MKEKTVYICTNCGYKASKWLGRCPNCGQWNAFKEESSLQSTPKVVDIKKIASKAVNRYKTGKSPIDDFLGGGFVEGGVYLIAGSPGVGKTTLLLQLCQYLQEQSAKTLYVSAEESIEQLSLKAQRLETHLLSLQTSELNDIIHAIKTQDFNLYVLDSIHTIFSNDVDSYAGSINQVRYCASSLVEAAKLSNKTLLIVSHITKEGVVAGPKTLEHLVDAVFYIDSDSKYNYRLLKATKNRFAKTDESVIFEMTQNGLEIVNDSFLTYIEDFALADGRAVGAILEGSYLMFLEIQALCVKSPFGIPRRTSVGFDLNRLNMLLAVLEKRLNLPLYEYDVYLNVIGGFKINSTLMDLAVVAAIVSSSKKILIPEEKVFLGEIDLIGNVRKIKLPTNLKEKLHKTSFKLFDASIIKNVKELLSVLQ